MVIFRVTSFVRHFENGILRISTTTETGFRGATVAKRGVVYDFGTWSMYVRFGSLGIYPLTAGQSGLTDVPISSGKTEQKHTNYYLLDQVEAC